MFKARRVVAVAFIATSGLLVMFTLSRSSRRRLQDYVPNEVLHRSATVGRVMTPTNQNREITKPYTPLHMLNTSTDDASNPTDLSWSDIQAIRIRHLQNICSEHPEYSTNLSNIILNDTRKLWSFVYNDEYKTVYASLCKVQSTSWKKLHMVLDGKYKRIEDVEMKKWSPLNSQLHYLRNLDPFEVETRLRDYTKYLIVREPFARALSGYRNKLYRRNAWFEKLVGTKIIAKFRKNASAMAKRTGIGVTFSEFLKHIAYLDDSELDGHWKPMYRMIYPCNIKYDYIGRLESGTIDIDNILEHINLSRFIPSFPKPEGGGKTSDHEEIFNSFYRDIDGEILRDVYWKLLPDIQLFGYEIPKLIKQKFEEIGFNYMAEQSNLTYFTGA